MTSPQFDAAYDLDDEADLQVLSAIVHEWEPRLDFYRPARNSFLYEPDGTLYAVALRDGMTFATDRRTEVVNAGDLVVLPRAHGVDAGEDVDLIAFCHDGTPPHHFRERFIQVWGFEHRQAPRLKTLFTDVVPASDVRLRIPYAVFDVSKAETTAIAASDELILLVTLSAQIALEVSDGSRASLLNVPPRHAVAVAPGDHCRVNGCGRIGVLTLFNELSHESRGATRLAARESSPEYVPEGG